MFQIIIVPKHSGAAACLYFNERQRAEAAQKTVCDFMEDKAGVMVISDDYGFVLTIDVTQVSYALLIDCELAATLPNHKPPKTRMYDS